MGDVIHALPVVSDLMRAMPLARIDWIVEEAFAELPALHPQVAAVVPVAVRRWRRTPLARATRAEIRAVKQRLRDAGYERALDLQGLIKSAWVARFTRAPVAGFSRACAREPLAAWFYRDRYDVDLRLHAIERLRSLAAQAFGYAVTGAPVFGLRVPDEAVPGLPQEPFAVLLHATSRADKQWPQANWAELIGRLANAGLRVALPWGSQAERQRAEQLAAGHPAASVLPRLSLRQCAAAIGRAHCVVGVDTGLTHLASALDAPTVALFAATPAWRFGSYWSERAVSLGSDGHWPDADEVLRTALRVADLRRSAAAVTHGA
ncbi:MAG: lipopolysaccharide heptosyltransferase I [Burkholderiales bacterium]|nr:lipopolysaccharide heptosyltransferase I [Burkholderiales bacterium]